MTGRKDFCRFLLDFGHSKSAHTPRMLLNRERLKLLHALIFFSEEVLFPGKTKLYKLLNYLDFLHYERTGRSVTGLDYYAWPHGPVPRALHEELDAPRPYFIEHLVKEKQVLTEDMTRQVLRPRVKFRRELFSDFQYELMQKLAQEHFRHKAAEMSELSHFETGPWHEVHDVLNQPQALIPYDLVLKRRGTEEDIETLEHAREREAFIERYR